MMATEAPDAAAAESPGAATTDLDKASAKVEAMDIDEKKEENQALVADQVPAAPSAAVLDDAAAAEDAADADASMGDADDLQIPGFDGAHAVRVSGHQLAFDVSGFHRVHHAAFRLYALHLLVGALYQFTNLGVDDG